MAYALSAVSAIIVTTTMLAVGQSARACTLEGKWALAELAWRESSTWTIAADGTATEVGLGNSKGHASLDGPMLTINFDSVSPPGYSVKVNVALQACDYGAGEAAFTY